MLMFKLEHASSGMALIWKCNIDWHTVGRTKEQWAGRAKRVKRIGCFLEAQPRGLYISLQIDSVREKDTGSWQRSKTTPSSTIDSSRVSAALEIRV